MALKLELALLFRGHGMPVRGNNGGSYHHTATPEHAVFHAQPPAECGGTWRQHPGGKRRCGMGYLYYPDVWTFHRNRGITMFSVVVGPQPPRWLAKTRSLPNPLYNWIAANPIRIQSKYSLIGWERIGLNQSGL